ncbi:MAG: hypothetical protein CME62_10780 [Halobacteriovoraceae bacterium]|nr:hypothetical protein [Halobacteriovoraceae bacterium]|tara:strand:- start:11479 stop:12867 length:1389 start_codon:yes stop_codon:yes gene_type:complete
MSHYWHKPRIFERVSNIYTFSQNPLFKKNVDQHFFMPWNEVDEPELMFKLKAQIGDKKYAYFPLFKGHGRPWQVQEESLEQIKKQLESFRETHLIMTNLQSIHVFRVAAIVEYQELADDTTQCFHPFKSKKSKFTHWLKIDDMFVLEANHNNITGTIEDELEKFISSPQTQNIFIPSKKQLSDNYEDEINLADRERWVDTNRNLTYDYFVRSSELKDNIYQESWEYLSRKTQHELITSDLERYSGIFYRDIKKWRHLKHSFDHYLNALYNELNEVYMFPLINAITDYKCLKEAWFDLDDSLVNPRVKAMVRSLLIGERKQVDSLEDFLFYTKSAKSFLFTLKNRFTKKIHKEEFLLVENFLCRQESLVESLICHKIVHKIEAIMHINNWMNKMDQNIEKVSSQTLNNCNLKLSHLMSIMTSASYEDNIFFKLIEEKAARGVSKKSFEDEVKTLLSIDFDESA